jgi:hypothetical protein
MPANRLEEVLTSTALLLKPRLTLILVMRMASVLFSAMTYLWSIRDKEVADAHHNARTEGGATKAPRGISAATYYCTMKNPGRPTQREIRV